MLGLYDSAVLKEAVEGIAAGTRCVLVDALDGRGMWLVECFDAAGASMDVVAADISVLEAPPRRAGETSQSAA
jgi:hypothetical protein